MEYKPEDDFFGNRPIPKNNNSSFIINDKICTCTQIDNVEEIKMLENELKKLNELNEIIMMQDLGIENNKQQNKNYINNDH